MPIEPILQNAVETSTMLRAISQEWIARLARHYFFM